MIRCVIQMVPLGDEKRAYTLGIVEIAVLSVDGTAMGYTRT